jgi:hypothetical protein
MQIPKMGITEGRPGGSAADAAAGKRETSHDRQIGVMFLDYRVTEASYEQSWA